MALRVLIADAEDPEDFPRLIPGQAVIEFPGLLTAENEARRAQNRRAIERDAEAVEPCGETTWCVWCGGSGRVEKFSPAHHRIARLHCERCAGTGRRAVGS